MDPRRNVRMFFYVAAFLLCMSACFIYAEPVPATASGASLQLSSNEAPLLFWTGPHRAQFLRPQPTDLLVGPNDLLQSAPVASPAVLAAVSARAHHHWFFRHSQPTATPLASSRSAQEDAAIRDLLSAVARSRPALR